MNLQDQDSSIHLRPLPRIGQELGRFLIEKELPRGGQARVYRTWQTDLQRPVALKLLPGSFSTDPEASRRFRAEIESVARISHPNIVRIYEAGEIDGHPYFTMEYLEGEDAESMLRRGPLGPDEAASIMEAVARAVFHAHRAGIVHRDIKPGNIILRGDDTPVLTDFGLAQDLAHSGQLTQTGISMGTPSYMAPEQARGERQRVGVKSDVYGLGATLFSLLTGRRPAEGESAYEVMVKVAESEGPRWSRAECEDIPADLRAIVEMAMQNDPSKRYDSADAFADDLERFLHGEWVVARSRSPMAKLWARSRRYVPVAAVVVVALALAAGMVYTGLNPQPGGNAQGPILDQDVLIGDGDSSPGDDVDKLFEGSWIKSGAQLSRGRAGEIVLTRESDGPVRLATRSATCWGDFTIATEFRVRDASGPLEFQVGLPPEGRDGEAAYRVVLGEVTRDRFVLRRHGEPVYSGYVQGPGELFAGDMWYRVEITRRSERIDFTMAETGEDEPVIEVSYEDDFAALVGGEDSDGPYGRKQFGIAANAAELSLRNVTVTHHDNRYSAEDVLFSVGRYAEAEDYVTARLTRELAGDAAPAQRNERAALLYRRARCYVRMGDIDAAMRDCADAKALVSDRELRSRVYLLSSRIETTRGNDGAAVAQLRVAQSNSGVAGDYPANIYHDAHNRARELEADTPERALVYYEFVATNALGRAWLVCDSLYRAAEIRLALGATPQEAVTILERIESAGYQRFGATFAPAMARLFELRLDGALADPEADTLEELAEAADWMARSVGGYSVPEGMLVEPLTRAAWAGRFRVAATDLDAYDRVDEWLNAVADDGAEPVYVAFQRALMGEERPTGEMTDRVALWREVANGLELDNPAHGAMAAVADYFLGTPVDDADQQRRNDVLRRALRSDMDAIAPHWVGDMDADAFADYCVALYTAEGAREAAVRRLENAALIEGAGMLKLLTGRAASWLPISG